MKFRFSLAIVGLGALSASLAFGQANKETKPTRPTPGLAPAAPANTPKSPANNAPATGGEHAMPSCFTPEEMQACMSSGIPGPMHQKLAESIGVWTGRNTMWMCPEDPPMKSESTTTITPVMDGRFIKVEVAGDMGDMGPFHGLGLYGYDNMTQKFQGTWVDGMSTTMMPAAGELSSDGKTMTWTYTYTCPLTKKLTTMREVHRVTGKDTQTMEMYMPHPKTGKEYKMMEVVMTRKPGTGVTAGTTTGNTTYPR